MSLFSSFSGVEGKFKVEIPKFIFRLQLLTFNIH